MADYTDVELMLKDIRYHARLTGHRSVLEVDPCGIHRWTCSTCDQYWCIDSYSMRFFLGDGLLWYGYDISKPDILQAYLDGYLDRPNTIPQGSSLLCSDPIEMVQSIRNHVLRSRHRVECADNPLNQSMGYTCVECSRDNSSRVPRVATWYVGLLALKSLKAVGEEADLLRGTLRNVSFREKLTRYLNRDGSPVLTRYLRPLVI